MLPRLARAHRRVLLPTPRALSTSSTTAARTVASPAPLSAAELEVLLRRDHYSASTRRFHSRLLLLPPLPPPRLRPPPPPPLPPLPPLSDQPLLSPPPPPPPPPSPSHLRLILPSRLKGRPLPLPSLPLRLAMLSAASALDAVFAPRAATFAYSARHAAIRYLRSIPNATWFFRVAIPRQPFATRHVRRLLDGISGKVDDPGFLDYLRELFLSDAIAFELGGSELCRGLPQESELTSTLLNIFFDPVDREVMAIREEVHKKNPRVKDDSVRHTPGEDQLPSTLVDSYDQLQETFDRFLMPRRGHDITEDEEMLAEEKEERQYEKRIVEDLTELKMRVNAPIELVRKA
ncbi:hypothetical protein ZWY2020_000812 [Hordeum vulgare]|nr:hypothetical protein ZWY2020_000812 [Hordeum vulgare]